MRSNQFNRSAQIMCLNYGWITGEVSRTVQRFMKNEGYKYINWKKEIVLSEAQKAARAEMCKKWLIEGVTSQNIVFTDETR